MGSHETDNRSCRGSKRVWVDNGEALNARKGKRTRKKNECSTRVQNTHAEVEVTDILRVLVASE